MAQIYQCSDCQYESKKWYGVCPNCSQMGTLTKVDAPDKQTAQNPKSKVGSTLRSLPQNPVQTIGEVLNEIKQSPTSRFHQFQSEQLNNFWNKGLIVGSLTLLAGEPGLGKSTLALQLLRSLWNSNKKLRALYITAEESAFELARRSQRLKIPPEISILQSNNFEHIQRVLTKLRPEVVILDSIQTLYTTELTGSPGSVTQVAGITSQLLATSKQENISIVLIGHVTKEGQIAGPKTLEHLVDSVIVLENAKTPGYRTLTFNKHRYGSTDTQLLLKMESGGLDVVADPGLALLANIERGVGVCYGMTLEKNLPLIVEVQSLVSNPATGEGSYGRREAIGLPVSKLNTVLAILEKYMGLHLKNREIYIQVTGFSKKLLDDSLDLVIALSVLSSIYKKPVEEILRLNTKTQAVFAGRLTLSGRIRPATLLEQREEATKKLKFNLNPGVTMENLSEIV